MISRKYLLLYNAESTVYDHKSFVSEFKDTFTSDGHVLFCVLCGNFFFFNAYFNDFRSIIVYVLKL
jgi:hypothetical protein